MDIHVSSGKKRLGVLSYRSLQWTRNVSRCLFEQGYMRKRESVLLQADTVGFFFSSGINFSPCVPSFQFLGRKETELTMQMSSALPPAISFRVRSLTTLNCRQSPFNTF